MGEAYRLQALRRGFLTLADTASSESDECSSSSSDVAIFEYPEAPS